MGFKIGKWGFLTMEKCLKYLVLRFLLLKRGFQKAPFLTNCLLGDYGAFLKLSDWFSYLTLPGFKPWKG